MRLLVTRPRPDAGKQAERLRASGHEVIVEPLIDIVYRDIGRLPLEGVQALVATSRNGLRALARNEALENARKLPLFAVGPATAAIGESLGIRRIHVCDGRATDMAERIGQECAPGAGCILHLAGSRLASDLKGDLEALGFRVKQPRLYESARLSALSADLVARIAGDGLDGLLLMSPFTAQSWVELVREAGVSDKAMQLRHYCLSTSVAAGLDGFAAGHVAVAENPNEDDLLALIDRETAD